LACLRQTLGASHLLANLTKATMHRKRVLVSLAGCLLAAMLGIADTADAALYSGRFDPIDFSGDFEITIPDACLTDGWHANDADCAVTLNSASADVLSTAPDPVYSGTLTFAPPEISDSTWLLGVYIVDGKLDSFDTLPIPYVSASPTTPDDWALQFSSGQMPCFCETDFRLSSFVAFSVAPPQPPKGVYLYANGNPSDPATYFDITRVPEPGTLPLIAGALLAGWLLRRSTSSRG
jgi:hypothetical protein